MEVAVATLSVVICLALAVVLAVRDAGGVPPAPSRWRVVIAGVEGALWLAVAVVAAPTLWELLT
jgi:hypothetical protein